MIEGTAPAPESCPCRCTPCSVTESSRMCTPIIPRYAVGTPFSVVSRYHVIYSDALLGPPLKPLTKEERTIAKGSLCNGQPDRTYLAGSLILLVHSQSKSQDIAHSGLLDSVSLAADQFRSWLGQASSASFGLEQVLTHPHREKGTPFSVWVLCPAATRSRTSIPRKARQFTGKIQTSPSRILHDNFFTSSPPPSAH